MLSRLANYARPAIILFVSAFFGFKTLLSRPATGGFRQAWFAAFWLYWGSRVEKLDSAMIRRIAGCASGVVLDLGPGAGDTVKYLDRSCIKHVYGLEPNTNMHAQLRRNLQLAGLEKVYTILPFGAEDADELFRAGLAPRSVDTVLTMKVLCSVPAPMEHTLGNLYDVLKSSGQWLVFEHVRNRRSVVTRGIQGFYQMFWPRMMAGCNLDRRTDELLPRVGKWEVIDLSSVREEEEWEVIPHTWGRLVKAGK